MNQKIMIKIVKLIEKLKKAKMIEKLKKDVKKIKKQKEYKMPPATLPHSNISNLNPTNISQSRYQPDFHLPIQKFSDPNKIEAEQFSQYKKSRGLLPVETRGIIPSEIELYSEFEKFKKLNNIEINRQLNQINDTAQHTEKKNYNDKITEVAKRGRGRPRKVILGIKPPSELQPENKIRIPVSIDRIIEPPPDVPGFSEHDSLGLESAIGGTDNEFIPVLNSSGIKEGPSIIGIGTKKVLEPLSLSSNDTTATPSIIDQMINSTKKKVGRPTGWRKVNGQSNWAKT